MRNIDPDEGLASEFVSDDWFKKTEPPEITSVAKSIEKSTALKPAVDKKPPVAEKPDPSDPPEAHEKERYVAGDRSTALDGFGSVALDKTSYYSAERLSENLDRTPENFLICRNAVIARTGFQRYRVAEIADPEGLLARAGITDPNADLDLWRDGSEVFSPATIASFEGKTFCVGHPANLLDPHSDRDHAAGHIQNVRRGREPLANGEFALVADIIVKDAQAIELIQSGERQLSCGYSYKLGRTGYRWEQREILGNHVALVPQGRAGSAVKIYDALPSASGRKPMSEREQLDEIYRQDGRRKIETVRNSIRRPL